MSDPITRPDGAQVWPADQASEVIAKSSAENRKLVDENNRLTAAVRGLDARMEHRAERIKALDAAVSGLESLAEEYIEQRNSARRAAKAWKGLAKHWRQRSTDIGRIADLVTIEREKLEAEVKRERGRRHRIAKHLTRVERVRRKEVDDLSEQFTRVYHERDALAARVKELESRNVFLEENLTSYWAQCGAVPHLAKPRAVEALETRVKELEAELAKRDTKHEHANCATCDADTTVTPGLCEHRAGPASGKLLAAKPVHDVPDVLAPRLYGTDGVGTAYGRSLAECVVHYDARTSDLAQHLTEALEAVRKERADYSALHGWWKDEQRLRYQERKAHEQTKRELEQERDAHQITVDVMKATSEDREALRAELEQTTQARDWLRDEVGRISRELNAARAELEKLREGVRTVIAWAVPVWAMRNEAADKLLALIGEGG